MNKQYNVTMWGAAESGKSALIVPNAIEENHYEPTIGVFFQAKMVDIAKQKRIKLNIGDTAGQVRFGSIRDAYLLNANAIIVCVDLSDKKKLKTLQAQIKAIPSREVHHLKFILVGTKSDLRVAPTDFITDDDLKEVASNSLGEKCIGCYVTSAKDNKSTTFGNNG